VDPDTLFYLIYAVAIAAGAVVAILASVVVGAITGALLGGAMLTIRQWAFRRFPPER
jgi:uncharacterized membrane protein